MEDYLYTAQIDDNISNLIMFLKTAVLIMSAAVMKGTTNR